MPRKKVKKVEGFLEVDLHDTRRVLEVLMTRKLVLQEEP